MPNRVRVLTVPDADRAELERRARAKGAPARVAERARIVLLAADGLTGAQIGERAGCTEPTVIKWRRQYAESGLAGTVTDACYPRHRHGEFLKFLKKVAAAYPGTGLHVVCDNYATHK